MRMALPILIALLLQAPAEAQVPQARPALAALPPESRNALQAWLQRDCTVGASPSEVARLRALPAPATTAALLEAHRLGPSPELERTFTAAFDAAFQARSDTLAREGAKLFGAEDAARLGAVDRNAYVGRRLAQARLNYRTNAVLGLGATGAREAAPLLQKIAADPNDPLQAAGRQALAQMESPPARRP